jgi:ATP-dependent protease ClpP protease subunit/hemerythrin superfamily protein
MAEVFIYGPIGENTLDYIKAINAATDRLDVYINSPGGNVYDGFAIFNALQRKKEILNTYIDGMAYSAASWLALSAKPENRYMSRSSFFGIHEAMNFSGGNKRELKASIDQLTKIDSVQVEIYTMSTGLSEDRIKAIMKRDEPLSFDEAQEFGFQEYEAQKIAAIFNFNDNMDLLEKLKSLGYAAKEEPTPEQAEEAKTEVQEEAKHSSNPAEALASGLVKKEDFYSFKKQFEPLVAALIEYIGEAPTIDKMKEIASESTKAALKEVLSQINSTGTVPTAMEAGFDDITEKEDVQELKADKNEFRKLFEIKTK